MDTTIALRQVLEARGRLTQALADLTVCKLDFDTSVEMSGPGPSSSCLPAPTALRDALMALDSAAGELGLIEAPPLAPVVELVPSTLEAPPEVLFARIPHQRSAAMPA